MLKFHRRIAGPLNHEREGTIVSPLQSTRIVVFSAVVLMLSSIPRAHSGDNRVVAVIGGEEISRKALEDEIAVYGKKDDIQAKLLTLTPDGKKEILDNLVKDTLFYRDAIDKGVSLDSETEKRLQRLRRDLLIKKYIQTMREKASATNGEMYDYYLKHKTDFVIPEKRKIRHIVVKTREAAEGIVKRLAEGGDFKALAKEYNIDGSKQKEGDLGWAAKGVMVKDFENAAFSLPEHQVSGVIKTGFGHHLIWVEEIKKPVQKSYRDAMRAIKARLEKDTMTELEDRLKEKYRVEMDYNGLDSRTGKKVADRER